MARCLIATHFDTLGGKYTANLRQKLRGHRLCHEQPFDCVAGAVLLRFGVVGNPDRHGHIAVRVHVDMAVAVKMLDDGHLGLAADAFDQALATARDDHIDILRHRNELADRFTVGRLHQLHGIGW